MTVRPLRIVLIKRPDFDLQKFSRLHNGLDAYKICGGTNFASPYQDGAGPAHLKVELYTDMVNSEDSRRGRWVRENLHLIRGKNLACICGASVPCHGDVLIPLANGVLAA